MKGKNNKTVIYVLLAVGLIVLLTVFRFECRICKQTKIDIPHKINVLGIEYKVCSKCYKTVGDMFNGLSDIISGNGTAKTNNNNVVRNLALSIVFFFIVLYLLCEPFRQWIKRQFRRR